MPPTLSLDHGAVVLDPPTGSITVNVGALLRTLGARLNALPPNTDLLAYVLNNLGRILSSGLTGVVNGIIDPVKALGQNCFGQLQSLPRIGALVKALTAVREGPKAAGERARAGREPALPGRGAGAETAHRQPR